MKNRLPSLLKSQAKKVNASIIEECTGVSNYKAMEDQRKEVFKHITNENYMDMLIRIKKCPDDDKIIGSSNFGKFMDYFTADNDAWVEEVNEVLEGCS